MTQSIDVLGLQWVLYTLKGKKDDVGEAEVVQL